MKITAAGLYPDIGEDAYHADRLTPRPSLSSTVARILLDRSPLHAWTASPRLNPDHEPRHSEAFDAGKLRHRLVLGKGADYVACPFDDWRTKDARAMRDDARAAGKVPVLEHQLDAALDSADAVLARMADFGIRPERTEVPAFAEIDGVWCRAMIDIAPKRGPLIDLKTCEDASPDACLRSVVNYGYDVQARWYCDTWAAATGERRGFRFVFVEKAAPYEVSVVELHDDPDDEADWMLDAASKCAEARRIWGECLAADRWPGYPSRVAVLGAPAWHRSRWADRETGRPITPKPTEAAKAAAMEMMKP